MKRRKIAVALRVCLALVWLVMGLGAKVLGWVPRHEEIVARILGADFAPLLTTLIGWGEVGMAVWILSGIRPRLCAWVQGVLVVTMNLLELALTRDLLLFGWGNGLAALALLGMIAVAEGFRSSPCSPS